MAAAGFAHAAEVAALALLAWRVARLDRGRELALLLVAGVYGLTLENVNQWLFGSYSYGRSFWLWVGDTPLAVGVVWAMVLCGSRAVSRAMGIKPWARPFMDALLACLLDFAIDTTAIRLGLWKWHGLGLADGWFGVPPINYFGWLVVQLNYSFAAAWIESAVGRRQQIVRLVVAPLTAVGALVAAIVAFSVVVRAAGGGDGGWGAELFGVVVVACAFAAVVLAGRETPAADGEHEVAVTHAAFERACVHVAFLLAVPFVVEPAARWPISVIALCALGSERLLTGWTLRRASVSSARLEVV